MRVPTAALTLMAATEGSIPPAGTALRTVVRVLLGAFIALLAAYIFIEQLGTWRRRRAHRDR